MGKKKIKKIKKEELAEDWCFVCKDGGDVRICDHKQCLKSYHPGCLEKDVSFLDSKSHFSCPWHNCSYCGKCAVLHCYTCTYSTCQRGDCIPTAAEFLRVKGENGFCHSCLKLVLLVEEGKDIDSDGERVDLTDLNSVEGLFMDYYLIVKKAKGIDLTDIHASRDHLKFRKDSTGVYYESDEDEVSDDDFTGCPQKRRKMQKGEKKYKKKELENGVSVSHTGFASIEVENIKLVYLTRSLLYELARQPECFEEKVIGSFVRIKTDPYDWSTRNSYQLMQVKGVKQTSGGENDEEIVLVFPTIYQESRISLISDDIFYERECEELKQKMVAGLLERPTVVKLEQKAKILHKDITKHWISKELALLNKRIEQANGKGWRCQDDKLLEYLEKRKKLETPSEQARLLGSVPNVIPETTSDSKLSSDDKNAAAEREEESPTSDGTGLKLQYLPVADGKTHHGYLCPSEKKTPVTDTCIMRSNNEKDEEPDTKAYVVEAPLSSQQWMESQERSTNEVVYLLSSGEDDPNEKFDDVESSKWCILGPNGERHKCSLFVLKRLSELTPYTFEFKIWREDEEEHPISLREAIRIAFPR